MVALVNNDVEPEPEWLERLVRAVDSGAWFATGKLLHEWSFPGPVRRVLYAPDNRHLLVAGGNGVLYILRLPGT